MGATRWKAIFADPTFGGECPLIPKKTPRLAPDNRNGVSPEPMFEDLPQDVVAMVAMSSTKAAEPQAAAAGAGAKAAKVLKKQKSGDSDSGLSDGSGLGDGKDDKDEKASSSGLSDGSGLSDVSDKKDKKDILSGSGMSDVSDDPKQAAPKSKNEMRSATSKNTGGSKPAQGAGDGANPGFRQRRAESLVNEAKPKAESSFGDSDEDLLSNPFATSDEEERDGDD